MIYEWEDHGQTYCIGTGKVILKKSQNAPTFREGRTAVCNFTAEVEAHPSGEKTTSGRDRYENTLMNFVCFGPIARYCRNFEHKDMFAFFGRKEIDPYWTEHSKTGEVAYKIVLEICMAQPTEDGGGYSGGYPADMPSGFEDLPDY